ncbi:MAG: hypothetical protein ABJG15_00925 [Hyphomonadaceae bacterium]
MAYFIQIRSIFGLALFGIGAVLLGSGAATAQSKSDQVQIYSGFETTASERTRTYIRTRRVGGQLVIDKRRVRLGGGGELRGGPSEAAGEGSRRAATGRSRESLQNGVRVINSRRS